MVCTCLLICKCVLCLAMSTRTLVLMIHMYRCSTHSVVCSVEGLVCNSFCFDNLTTWHFQVDVAKAIENAQFVYLVYQVFYHRRERINNCWRVTLTVFSKRLHKVSSSNCSWTACMHKFALIVSHFQHSHERNVLRCMIHSAFHERKELATPNGCNTTEFWEISFWFCIWQWLYIFNL